MGKMGHAIAELAPSRGWEVVATLGADGAKARHHASDARRRRRRGRVHRRRTPRRRTFARSSPPACPSSSARQAGTTQLRRGRSADVAGDERRAAHGDEFLARRQHLRADRRDCRAPAWPARRASRRTSSRRITRPRRTRRPAPRRRSARRRRRPGGSEIPITSIRTGSVPGTHEFIFDAPFEQIHLEHIARDRRVFAEGALVAAAWLIGKHGVFTMQDVLGTDRMSPSSDARMRHAIAHSVHSGKPAGSPVRHGARHAVHRRRVPSTRPRCARSSTGRSPKAFTSSCRAAARARRRR